MQKLLTIAEVCELLQIHRTTLWRMVDQGKLRPTKIGVRAVRFQQREVERLVDRATKTVR